MSTLANARDVLALIARRRRDLTVTDAAQELDAPKSSVSRTLAMMAEYGFLDRDPITKAYRPGPLVMEASYHFRASQNVVSLFEGEIGKLIETFGYTGYITTLVGNESLVIHMRSGTAGTLQAYTPVGTRAPSYASSMGRAILARLDDAEAVARAGNRFEQFGQAPHSRGELLAQLAEIRTAGWVLSRGEVLPDVAGFSSAAHDPGTDQTFAIGIALPVTELSDALIDRCSIAVRDAAMRVGRSVGDPYWLAFRAA